MTPVTVWLLSGHIWALKQQSRAQGFCPSWRRIPTAPGCLDHVLKGPKRCEGHRYGTFSRSSCCCSFSRSASPRHCSSFGKRKAHSARGTNTAPGAAACPKHFTIKKNLEILNFSSKERSCLSAAVKGAVSELSHSHCRLPLPSGKASKSSKGSGEDELGDLNPVLISFSTSRLSNVAALSVSLCLSSRFWVLTCSTEHLGYKHQS